MAQNNLQPITVKVMCIRFRSPKKFCLYCLALRLVEMVFSDSLIIRFESKFIAFLLSRHLLAFRNCCRRLCRSIRLFCLFKITQQTCRRQCEWKQKKVQKRRKINLLHVLFVAFCGCRAVFRQIYISLKKLLRLKGGYGYMRICCFYEKLRFMLHFTWRFYRRNFLSPVKQKLSKILYYHEICHITEDEWKNI